MFLGFRATVAAVLVGAMLLSAAVPVHADVKSFLYSRKFFGAVSMASSLVFFKEAYDARKEANRNYKSYKAADTQTLATNYYNEVRRGDTRMALMLGLGVGTMAYGVYVYFLDKGGDDLDQGAKGKENKITFKGVGMDVQGDVQGRGVKFHLSRKF